MSESSEQLVTSLLEGDPAQREALLRGAPSATLEAALKHLGERREVAAAQVLLLVDGVVEDRGLRKAARRELHRLRSRGVEVPRAAATPQAVPEPHAEATLPVSQAWASDIDATGSRALWLLAERPLGGVWFAALVFNDLRGLQDMNIVDTTRKRFLRELEQNRGSGAWISIPGDYALQLVREAVDLTREVGAGLPTRYRALREVLGEAPSAPPRALVYETISPVEASFNPEWLEVSPSLFGEPELAGWHVTVPAELRARAVEVARGPSVSLLVPGRTPEQQALQLVGEAAQQSLTPQLKRALRRRLEETAYIFVATDRLRAGRLAVAAARALDDPSVPPEQHPFVRFLLAGGLARLLGAEQMGGRSAAEILVELIERAAQPRAQTGSTETRPSGLVLPR